MDWTDLGALRSAVKRLSMQTGHELRIDIRLSGVRLLGPGGAITGPMAVSELRAFVEGMLVSV